MLKWLHKEKIKSIAAESEGVKFFNIYGVSQPMEILYW